MKVNDIETIEMNGRKYNVCVCVLKFSFRLNRLSGLIQIHTLYNRFCVSFHFWQLMKKENDSN